ncbi:hypothetical protein MRX96_035880 [Rhipicephalus microplus]
MKYVQRQADGNKASTTASCHQIEEPYGASSLDDAVATDRKGRLFPPPFLRVDLIFRFQESSLPPTEKEKDPLSAILHTTARHRAQPGMAPAL